MKKREAGKGTTVIAYDICYSCCNISDNRNSLVSQTTLNVTIKGLKKKKKHNVVFINNSELWGFCAVGCMVV